MNKKNTLLDSYSKRFSSNISATLKKFSCVSKDVTISEALELGVYNEEYYLTEEMKKSLEERFNKLSPYGKILEVCNIEETEELFGPIRKNLIEASDFIKLNYLEYQNKIKLYKEEWLAQGLSSLVKFLQEFESKVEKVLEENNAELREYYLLDATKMPDEKIEIDWFCFFSIISISKKLNNIIVTNFAVREDKNE